MRSKNLAAIGLMIAIGALGPAAEPVAPAKPREPVPRKFTDARKAEAEAKRKRKAYARLRNAGLVPKEPK